LLINKYLNRAEVTLKVSSGVVGYYYQEGCSRARRGSLISSTYERSNGIGKKAATAKITSWTIRGDVVRKLDRGEPEPQTLVAGDATNADSDSPAFSRLSALKAPFLRRGAFFCAV
jgi:hypothetical protein